MEYCLHFLSTKENTHIFLVVLSSEQGGTEVGELYDFNLRLELKGWYL